MPCDPDYLANIRIFEHLTEDDRTNLADVIDELKVNEGVARFSSLEKQLVTR